MEFDKYFEDTDSFSAMMEKEEANQLVQKQKEMKKEDRRCVIWNVIVPISLLFILFILFACFNVKTKDGCGCTFESDVSTNIISGDAYVQCVFLNLDCYSNIEFK